MKIMARLVFVSILGVIAAVGIASCVDPIIDPQTLTVSFDKNAVDAVGSMDPQDMAEGESAPLTACAFTRAGYTFVGWALVKSGAVKYGDGGSFTMGSADATLYARWNMTTAGPAEDFIYTITSDEVTVTGYTGTDAEVVIPNLIEGCPVVATEGVFLNNDDITSVVIPEGMILIGSRSFNQCSNLASIIIPDSITTIGPDAFGFCSALSSIDIPDSVTTIGSSAFVYCSSLGSVTIPDSVIAISDYTFYHCTGLISVTIGNSVTSIGGRAFNGASALATITIPDSVTTIGMYAFAYCPSLSTATIGSSVQSMEQGVFTGSGLAMLTMRPASPPALGTDVFTSCPLTTIHVPASADHGILAAYTDAGWAAFATTLAETP